MAYFVIQRDPGRFPFGTHVSVQADDQRMSGETFELLRDDRVCWTAPAADIVHWAPYETQLAAQERLKELRRWRSGRSTVKVTEGGVTGRGARRTNQGGRGEGQGPGRGIAEGISIRINET